VQGRTKQHTQTEAELREPAISKLVRGLRRDLQKKFGRVDYDKLRKDGFSELLLSRLHDADLENPATPSMSSSTRPKQS
jgi:hypothetical protein